MEHIFKTQLTIEGQARSYDVFFADEEYHFAPLDGVGPEIILMREADEWHYDPRQDEALIDECLGLLDQYLLSQH
jgi:hypothetical protein